MPPLVVLSLVLSLTAGADVRVSSLEEPADLDGAWRFFAGDGPFAGPDVADDAWLRVQVPGGLGEQGHRGYVGVYWLRLRVAVPAVDRELSLRLGPIDSAAQVFIDGRLVGESGRVDAPHVDAHDRHSLWPVPLDAAADGEIVVAVRGWRSALRADAAPRRGGINAGPNLLGSTADIVRAEYWRDIDKLIAGGVVLMVALYHLQLFRRRRQERHYLWFGLFSTLMAAHLLSSTGAAYELLGTMAHARVFWASLILTLPAFLQFLWPFLGRPIRWWWRVNQAAMIGYVAVAVAWPTQWFVIKFIGWFELVLLAPLMTATTALVVTTAWRGNQEARTLLVGTLALVLAAAQNIVVERTSLQLPEIMSYAMAAFVFSIAVSLANRFSRVFSELDEKSAALVRMERLTEEVRMLNAHVQVKVTERSEELARALAAFAEKRRDEIVADGTVLDGRFAIERGIGAGGMGAVYAGRDLATGARVAIKVVRTSSVRDVEALQRFLREARAAVAVDHPAIVRMLHVDMSADGLFYQVQELVDGVTLEERLSRGALAPATVARAGAVLAEALARAHASGVVHRDVKPSNVMLCAAAPGVKLLDFGVAKLTSAPADHTGTGRHIGTPAYMAPEQRFIGDDAAVTDRVDVYALGVVLHRMITGALPSRAAHLEASAPADLAALVHACLREEPQARPAAADLAARLAAVAEALGAPAVLAWDPCGDGARAGGITDLMRELVRAP